MRVPLVLALLGSLVACAPGLDPLEPVLGCWVTDDPRYEDCALTFGEGGVLHLGNARADAEVCHVLQVEPATDGGLRVVFETDRGVEDRLDLVLIDDEHLRIRHQAAVWVRQ